MSRRQSFATFGDLLDALVNANNLADDTLAKELEMKGKHRFSRRALNAYRRGAMEPSYTLVETLVSTNVLNLDPEKLRPEGDGNPAGEHRLALFTAADLIEVTPPSVQEWNREVLANVRRFGGKDRAGRTLQWGDVMTKLLSFHSQAGRNNFPGISNAIQKGGHPELFTAAMRLCNILNSDAVSTEAEREALGRYAGLDPEQIAEIESWIDQGVLLSGRKHCHAGFAGVLTDILDKLSGQGMNATQLIQLCNRQEVAGGALLKRPDLSGWRLDYHLPTLQKLRVLAAGLRCCDSTRFANPVTPVEIEALVAGSGFRLNELTDTTHDIIARIDAETTIKPLLRALRDATDVNLPQGVAPAPSTLTPHPYWEHSGKPIPTGSQIVDLLNGYNQVIRSNGGEPLSDEEIARVVAVAERDFSARQELSHAAKVAERGNTSKRSPLSPFF